VSLISQALLDYTEKDLVELPEDILAQFPIIPDGVDVIEIPDGLEKVLKPIFRAFQVFKGLVGKWVTIRGKPVFLKGKGPRVTAFIEETLEKGPIQVISEPVGAFVFPVTFKNGLGGIFRTGVKGEQELKAFSIAKAIGWEDMLPITIRRTGSTVRGPGVMQHFAPGKTEPGIGIEFIRGSRRSLPKVADKDMGRAAAFDYVTGQRDRHAFNYLIQGKSLKLIDHEFIFPRFLTSGPGFELPAPLRIAPGGISSDLLFTAMRKKIPIKDFVGPLNKVDWPKLFQELKVSKLDGDSFLARLRILNEGADKGLDFSTLGNTPLIPDNLQTLANLRRVPIPLKDFFTF